MPDITNLRNYVYESHDGEGSSVYHIEGSVAFKEQASVSFPAAMLSASPVDSNKNPDHVKQGGRVTVGPVAYRVEPLAPRRLLG